MQFWNELRSARCHLLVLVSIPHSDAEVFVVAGDELWLAFFKEESVREENFTARYHFLFGVFGWLSSQFVNQHVEGHIISTLKVLLLDDFFYFEGILVLDHSLASEAARNLVLSVVLMAVISIEAFIFTAHFITLVLVVVAALKE